LLPMTSCDGCSILDWWRTRWEREEAKRRTKWQGQTLPPPRDETILCRFIHARSAEID